MGNCEEMEWEKVFFSCNICFIFLVTKVVDRVMWNRFLYIYKGLSRDEKDNTLWKIHWNSSKIRKIHKYLLMLLIVLKGSLIVEEKICNFMIISLGFNGSMLGHLVQNVYSHLKLIQKHLTLTHYQKISTDSEFPQLFLHSLIIKWENDEPVILSTN